MAVLGANGAGKTTLLRVLFGLLRPHSGVVRVLGADLRASAGSSPPAWATWPTSRCSTASSPAARTCATTPGCTASGRSGWPSCSTPWAWTAARDEPLLDLSRGMVQRLAAARALLHGPDLLLLDEPRANLDPAGAELLEPLIGRASGSARVLVTHDVEAGLAEADWALGLRRAAGVRHPRGPGGPGRRPRPLLVIRTAATILARTCASSCARRRPCRR